MKHPTTRCALRTILTAAGIAGAGFLATFVATGDLLAQNALEPANNSAPAPAFVPVDADEPPPPAPVAPPKPVRKVVEFAGKDFESGIAGKIALVEFYTNASPSAQEILNGVVAATTDDVVVGRLNLSLYRQKIREYNIKNVPTFIVFQNGVAMSTFVGKRSKNVFVDSINALRGVPAAAEETPPAAPAAPIVPAASAAPAPAPAQPAPAQPIAPNNPPSYYEPPAPQSAPATSTAFPARNGSPVYASPANAYEAPASATNPPPGTPWPQTAAPATPEPAISSASGLAYIRVAGYGGTPIKYEDGTRAFNGGGGGVLSGGYEWRGEHVGFGLEGTLTAGGRSGSYQEVSTSLVDVNVLFGPRIIFGGSDSAVNFSVGGALGVSALVADYGTGIWVGDTILYRASSTAFCGAVDALLSLQPSRHFAIEFGGRLVFSAERDLGSDYGGLILKKGAMGQFQIGIRAAW